MDVLSIANCVNIIVDLIFVEESEDEEMMNEVIKNITTLKRVRGEKPVRILNYYEITIPAITEKQFQMHFRLTRQSCTVLENFISGMLMAKPTSKKTTIQPRKQILMTLWLLATPDSFRSVGDRFDVSKSTLWICFSRVVKSLNKIASTLIKWPDANERMTISRKFQIFGNINHVVGAIDGTYIPIKAPRENPESYINRKCFHGITLQAISDASLKFTNCFTGFPSSVSDIRVFKNSDIYRKMLISTDEFFSENEFLIGDKAYPLYLWCIPPYINRGNLGVLEENFNTKHARTRQVIERTFALYFGRFRRMQYLDMNRSDMYAMTILGACVLHNLCLMNNDNEIEHYINEGMALLRNDNAEQENEREVALHILTQEGIAKRNAIARQLLIQ